MLKMQIPRNSLEVQWLGLWAFTAVKVWSLVGGANILQVTQLNNNKKADSLQSRLRDFQSLSRVWLCDPMDCSTPGLPVHHQIPEFTQTQAHWVSDASKHLILCCPLLLPPSIFPSIRVFSRSQLFASGGQSIGASASASVLCWMNI